MRCDWPRLVDARLPPTLAEEWFVGEEVRVHFLICPCGCTESRS